MNMYLPVALVVLSNTVYHICAKSTPSQVNPLAALSVTYLVSAISSLLFYVITSKGDLHLLQEYRQLNWASIVMGITIVGLEAGFLLMYKAGWQVSTGQIVTSALLAVLLVAVGYLLYKEEITLTKMAGMAICLFGLYLLNK